MSQGIGMLQILTASGVPAASWAIAEGGGVTTDLNGQPFTFHLERAPNLGQFDIREMSAVDIAAHLAQRLKDEESERRGGAYEQSMHD